MGLCANSSSTNQVLEAMKWYFGKRHCRSVTFVNDTVGDQDGKYFDLNTITNEYEEKKYQVLLSDGTTTTITGMASDVTLITVTYVSGDTGAEIAALAKTAIEAASTVRTELTSATLEILNHFVGLVTTEVNTNATGLIFTLGEAGFGGYLGQTGESEMTTTIDTVQLVDDAQGTVIQDEIITGTTVEMTLPIREMTTQRWQDLIGSVTGSTVTIDGEEITGMGTAKLYNSMFLYSGRLVGHPVRNPAATVNQDIVMLNTAPKMNSINFSGASIQEAEFVFSAYKDANVDTGINLVARGDHTKF